MNNNNNNNNEMQEVVYVQIFLYHVFYFKTLKMTEAVL
jgi:hypothetical protein